MRDVVQPDDDGDDESKDERRSRPAHGFATEWCFEVTEAPEESSTLADRPQST